MYKVYILYHYSCSRLPKELRPARHAHTCGSAHTYDSYVAFASTFRAQFADAEGERGKDGQRGNPNLKFMHAAHYCTFSSPRVLWSLLVSCSQVVPTSRPRKMQCCKPRMLRYAVDTEARERRKFSVARLTGSLCKWRRNWRGTVGCGWGSDILLFVLSLVSVDIAFKRCLSVVSHHFLISC
jgi:hypothetical protein